MITCIVTTVSLPLGTSGNTNALLDFDQLRHELNRLSDKTAYELVKLVRRHSTKERLMRIITDRIEPNTIPTMNTIANIVNSVSAKYLAPNGVWS